MVFHIQEEFRPHYHKFLSTFIDQVYKAKDTTTKRVAIDAIYSIGAHLTDEIFQHKDEILKCLNDCKTDKSQPVRAAAQETIKLIKDLEVNKSFDEEIDDGLPLGEIDQGEYSDKRAVSPNK